MMEIRPYYFLMIIAIALCLFSKAQASVFGGDFDDDNDVDGADLERLCDDPSAYGIASFASEYGQSAPGTTPVAQPLLRVTLPASRDEDWFASTAVFDLNRDGEMEIIASRHSVLYVWSASGALLWRAPVGENASSPTNHGSHRQYASPVVGDLDGDGDGEIAIAYSNRAAVYDHNGNLLSGWPKSFPGPSGELRSIAAGDLNMDGVMEIITVKTSSGPVTVAWHLDGRVVPGWPQVRNCDECSEYGGYNQNIGVADLNGDRRPEVISTYDNCHIGVMYSDGRPFPAHSMFSGPFVSSVPMFHDINLAIQGWGADDNDRDEFTDSPPVFADVDGDGDPEIVLYSDHELAGEYINRGNCLWVLNPDLSRPAGFETPICSGMPLYTGYENNIVQVAPSPALADLLGDKRPEIIVPSYDGKLYCFSGDGRKNWEYRFDPSAAAPFIGASGPAAADLNGDGIPEILFTTYSVSTDLSHLIILTHQGRTLHRIRLAKRGSMSTPTIADVDGDGILEIVISLKDTLGGGLGGVQIWNVASARSGHALPWPTGRGNLLRNGRYASP